MSAGERPDPPLADLLERIRAGLRGAGLEVDARGDATVCCGGGSSDPRVKIVCVAPGLGDSVRELGGAPRDQVVMVRVDEETARTLDAWIEAGAAKSRSEAAALFIREGLKVRADELERLREALAEVESARERLRRRAADVFGDAAGEGG